MALPDGGECFDYAMSDTFVSGISPIPYRTGFRPRRRQGKPSIEELNQLSDREFDRYIRNGCRLPGSEPVNDLTVLEAKVEEMSAVIRTLQQQVRLLMQSSSGMRPSAAPSESRGLDVKPRA